MKINFFPKNFNSGKSLNLFVVNQNYLDSNKDFTEALNSSNLHFQAKLGQTFFSQVNGNLAIITIIADESKLTNVNLQKTGGKIFSFINSNKISSVNINLYSNLSTAQICNLAFGFDLQSYRFNQYFYSKKEDKILQTKEVNFICDSFEECNLAFEQLKIVSDAVFFARDLVSQPGNSLNPESYAEICQSLVKFGLEVEVLGEQQMKSLGMNSLLAVGNGSIKESKLVILKWNGGNKNEKPIAFVGKGVTFDSGGISIKPSANMEDMKTDMAGSAVVVSLLKLLATRKAKVNAVGVVGLVENMPSGSAQRPGDVVESMSKQTIEVVNTDAEGRMVLADAIYYTRLKFNPKFIIDLATLTGAIIISLADIYAGLFSNNDNLANNLISAGEMTGENLWRMPVGDAFDDMINSDIADMKNVGSGRGAGSTTAAQFIKRFIDCKIENQEEIPAWAHLDIAGVSWKGKGDPLSVKGATAFGVRLLNQLIVDNYENE